MGSVDLIVVRGQGLRQGPDIEDRLICQVDVALQKGRNECDENSGLQSVEITSFLRTDLRCGKLVLVEDSLQGESWVGKITYVRHYVSLDDTYSDVRVVRVK